MTTAAAVIEQANAISSMDSVERSAQLLDVWDLFQDAGIHPVFYGAPGLTEEMSETHGPIFNDGSALDWDEQLQEWKECKFDAEAYADKWVDRLVESDECDDPSLVRQLILAYCEPTNEA